MNGQSSEDLKIVFEGETHQIEANTLINSLLHFTNIVQEVNKDLQTHRKVEVKVNALPEGSFLIHLTVDALGVVDAAKNLFEAGVLAVASDIVTTVSGIYGLGQFLKGKNPKKIEAGENQTSIENVEGDVMIFNNPVFNIYSNNRTVQEALSSEFETLNNDESVTGFTILDKENKELVSIEKKEFGDLSNIEDNKVLPNERVVPSKGTLSIYTLSFDKNIKWTFYYEGNKITAKISEDFVARIDNGEKFAKGDSLEAEFEIRQQFDQAANTYINKGYKITKILKHIPRAEQAAFDFKKKK